MNKTVCKKCGAEFDVSLVRCPFCGTAYAPAEEAEYMDTLEEVREDLLSQVDNGGSEVGHEEENNPYYSEVNPVEVQHKKNMHLFKNRYEDTEKKVSRFAKAVEGLGKKAAILVVLLIGIIAMRMMTSLNYADPDEEAKVRRDAEKNAATYAEEADDFLENGEYVEFVSFLYAHELMNIPPDEFKRFRSVQYVAKEYYECIGLMEEMILRSDDPDYHDGLDTDIKNFCMYVDGFYEVLEAQKSTEKDEVYLAYILDMDNELHAAMRTYFSMDEKGVNEFLSMSRAQKAVKLSEVLRHE